MSPLLLTLALSTASGETLPAGEYTVTGQVVEKADGQVTVFWGRHTQAFPPGTSEPLRAHLGAIVTVTYERGGESMIGTPPIVGIVEVETIAASTRELPVTATLDVTQPSYALSEPVEATVTVRNNSPQTVTLHQKSATLCLCQDYEAIACLETNDHYGAGYPGTALTPELAPNTALTWAVTAPRMVEPGDYQLIFAGSMGARTTGQLLSTPLPVTILPADTSEDERAALRGWMTRASHSQLPALADRLLALGDTYGRDLLLEKAAADPEIALKNNGWLTFIWEHQQTAIPTLANHTQTQSQVTRLLDNSRTQPDRLDTLLALLALPDPVHKDVSGWTEGPRIQDLTASWLAGYTDDAIRFPHDGTAAERDAAIAQVTDALKTQPELFSLTLRSPPPGR